MPRACTALQVSAGDVKIANCELCTAHANHVSGCPAVQGVLGAADGAGHGAEPDPHDQPGLLLHAAPGGDLPIKGPVLAGLQQPRDGNCSKCSPGSTRIWRQSCRIGVSASTVGVARFMSMDEMMRRHCLTWIHGPRHGRCTGVAGGGQREHGVLNGAVAVPAAAGGLGQLGHALRPDVPGAEEPRLAGVRRHLLPPGASVSLSTPPCDRSRP